MTTAEFGDASWFPLELHVLEKWFGFAHVPADVIERSAFLDTRIEASIDVLEPVSVADLPELPAADAVGWIFHTSFCGSTLLARALHGGMRTVLREPLYSDGSAMRVGQGSPSVTWWGRRRACLRARGSATGGSSSSPRTQH